MGNASQMEEVDPADDGGKLSETLWKTMAWATYDGEFPVMKTLPSIYAEMEDHSNRSAWRDEGRPRERLKMVAQGQKN